MHYITTVCDASVSVTVRVHPVLGCTHDMTPLDTADHRPSLICRVCGVPVLHGVYNRTDVDDRRSDLVLTQPYEHDATDWWNHLAS